MAAGAAAVTLGIVQIFERAAAMRVHAEDPSAIPALVEFFESQGDAIVEPRGPQELEVSILGSFRHDAARLELELRLAAWAAAHRDFLDVAVLD